MSSRRDFLHNAGAFTIALTSTVSLVGLAEAHSALNASASSKVRWGLLIDVSGCADGCDACVSACSAENGWTGNRATDPQWIRKVTLTDRKNATVKSLPLMCQHCAYPPCVDVCPTGASFKRADGIVLVDKHICIGCRYCAMACPYGARSFVHEPLKDQKPHAPRGKGTIEGCTMCVHRIDEGRTPACVEACDATGGKAMLFGDLNDPESEISKRIEQYATGNIRADLGTDPGVHYQNL